MKILDLETIEKAAIALGEVEPCIRRIWGYGSAFESNFQEFDDIDLAIETEPKKYNYTDDQSTIGTFMSEEKNWISFLRRELSGYAFHLYPYDPKIVQNGIILYERSF